MKTLEEVLEMSLQAQHLLSSLHKNHSWDMVQGLNNYLDTLGLFVCGWCNDPISVVRAQEITFCVEDCHDEYLAEHFGV